MKELRRALGPDSALALVTATCALTVRLRMLVHSDWLSAVCLVPS